MEKSINIKENLKTLSFNIFFPLSNVFNKKIFFEIIYRNFIQNYFFEKLNTLSIYMEI